MEVLGQNNVPVFGSFSTSKLTSLAKKKTQMNHILSFILNIKNENEEVFLAMALVALCN